MPNLLGLFISIAKIANHEANFQGDSSCLWKVNPQTGKTKHCRWGHLPFLSMSDLCAQAIAKGYRPTDRQTASQPAPSQAAS